MLKFFVSSAESFPYSFESNLLSPCDALGNLAHL